MESVAELVREHLGALLRGQRDVDFSTAAAAVWASIARTLVPAIVGQMLGLWGATDLPVDDRLEPALTVFLGLVLTGTYYAGVRVLETYVAPRVGWLLGLARTPAVYTAQSPAAAPDPLAAPSSHGARWMGEGEAPMGRCVVGDVDSGTIGSDSADR